MEGWVVNAMAALQTAGAGLCGDPQMDYLTGGGVQYGRVRDLNSVADAYDAGSSAALTELMELCAAGDRAAFRRLYELQSPRLYGVAMRVTRQTGLAADAVHDAFLQVWQNAGKFDASRGNVEAWLLSLVRYRALDIARRRMREVPGAEVPEEADSDPDPLAHLVSSTEGAALHRCLKTLEPDRQALLSLAFVEGLTHSELSSRLNLPLGTVKSWIRRALAALKACLEA
jgi:RNA polymerase sigma-70 factor (ECF subfamily)